MTFFNAQIGIKLFNYFDAAPPLPGLVTCQHC
jgi:hypothetical protein